jgi:hypothetical protein
MHMSFNGFLFVLCFALLGFVSCNRESIADLQNEPKLKQVDSSHVIAYPNVFLHYRFGYMGDYFKVNISQMDWNDSARVHPPREIEEKRIRQIINDFYFIDCQGDSTESAFKLKDTYITTIYYYNRPFGLYIVLLQHPLLNQLQSKILVRFGNDYLEQVVDFNLHALYNYKHGRIVPSNLRQKFGFNQPEVEITVPKPGAAATAFILRRLYHNGTANAKETIILNATRELTLDTVYFKRDYEL